MGLYTQTWLLSGLQWMCYKGFIVYRINYALSFDGSLHRLSWNQKECATSENIMDTTLMLSKGSDQLVAPCAGGGGSTPCPEYALKFAAGYPILA